MKTPAELNAEAEQFHANREREIRRLLKRGNGKHVVRFNDVLRRWPAESLRRHAQLERTVNRSVRVMRLLANDMNPAVRVPLERELLLLAAETKILSFQVDQLKALQAAARANRTIDKQGGAAVWHLDRGGRKRGAVLAAAARLMPRVPPSKRKKPVTWLATMISGVDRDGLNTGKAATVPGVSHDYVRKILGKV